MSGSVFKRGEGQWSMPRKPGAPIWLEPGSGMGLVRSGVAESLSTPISSQPRSSHVPLYGTPLEYTPPARRECAHEGCGTILRSTRKGNMCSIHEEPTRK